MHFLHDESTSSPNKYFEATHGGTSSMDSRNNAVNPLRCHGILDIKPTAAWQLQFCILHSKVTLRLSDTTKYTLHILSNLPNAIENKLAMAHGPELLKLLNTCRKRWTFVSWYDRQISNSCLAILENKKMLIPRQSSKECESMSSSIKTNESPMIKCEGIHSYPSSCTIPCHPSHEEEVSAGNSLSESNKRSMNKFTFANCN